MKYLKALGVLIGWWLSISVIGSLLLAVVGIDERIAGAIGLFWGIYQAYTYLKQKSLKHD